MAMQLQPLDDGLAGLDESPMQAVSKYATIAWRRKALLLLGLFGGLVLGALSYAHQSPVYQSAAQVLVIKKRPDVFVPGAGDPRAMFAEDYLGTHMILIQSDEVLLRAAKAVDLAALSLPPVGNDTVGLIRAGLSVTRDKDANSAATNILSLTFRSAAPADCPRLINAVIKGYKDFLDEAYGDTYRQTQALIARAETVFKEDLVKARAKYEQVYARNPLALKTKDSVQVLQERVGRVEGKVATLALRQKEIETRQKMVAQSLKEGQSRTAVAASLRDKEAVAAGKLAAGAPAVEDTLLQLRLRDQELAQSYGPNHPERTAVRNRIDFIQKQSGQLAREKAEAKGIAGDVLDQTLALLKSEYEENRMLLEALTPELQAQRDQAQELAKYLIEEDEARNEVRRLQAMCENLSDQIRRLKLTGDAGGFDAQVVTPAKAGFKVAPSLFSTLALGGLGGLLAGLMLAMVADYTDKSFRSPGDIRQRLGLPVVGHLPYFQPTAVVPAVGEQLAAELCSVHSPRSPAAEAVRGLRTALFFSTHGRGHQVVQMTSPRMGDGKSTIAANLAVAIAQAGKRVVLIDADLRRPRLHRLFPTLDRGRGLTALIRGAATLADIVQVVPVPGLAVVPAGDRVDNPAELLNAAAFPQAIQELRARFDFVLIDTPPVLAVSDTSVVAPHVDGVLLIVRVSKNNRGPAESARDALAALGVTVLGVVVNDAEAAARHGYGYDGYGYDTRRGYGYVYSYQYSEASSYAESTDDDPPPRALGGPAG